MPKPGKSAEGKSAKAGGLMSGSKMTPGGGGAGAPPKTQGGMIRKPKAGK